MGGGVEVLLLCTFHLNLCSVTHLVAVDGMEMCPSGTYM